MQITFVGPDLNQHENREIHTAPFVKLPKGHIGQKIIRLPCLSSFLGEIKMYIGNRAQPLKVSTGTVSSCFDAKKWSSKPSFKVCKLNVRSVRNKTCLRLICFVLRIWVCNHWLRNCWVSHCWIGSSWISVSTEVSVEPEGGVLCCSESAGLHCWSGLCQNRTCLLLTQCRERSEAVCYIQMATFKSQQPRCEGHFVIVINLLWYPIPNNIHNRWLKSWFWWHQILMP